MIGMMFEIANNERWMMRGNDLGEEVENKNGVTLFMRVCVCEYTFKCG